VHNLQKIVAPLLLAVVAAAGAFYIFHLRAPAPGEVEGLLWPPGEPLPDFTLRTQRGGKFDVGDLKGRWSWLFFGYTECPDICPTTLRTLNRIAEQLAGDREAQFIFVSIDPAHDGPEQMRRYLETVAPKVTGLSGDAAEIGRIAGRLGIAHEPAANPSASGTIEHTAAILLLDPQARRVAVFTPPFEAAALVRRYAAIRRFVTASS